MTVFENLELHINPSQLYFMVRFFEFIALISPQNCTVTQEGIQLNSAKFVRSRM